MKDTTGHEKLKCLTEHTPLKTLVRFLFQGTHLQKKLMGYIKGSLEYENLCQLM